MKFKIVELSHDDLVFFIHYALCYLYISSDNENGKLISNTSNLEEMIADILVGGGEIKVSDFSALFENDFHNTNNLRTSMETIPGYSLSRNKCVNPTSENIKEVKVPTYHITLQDIYNGINKEEAMSHSKDLFFHCGISNVKDLMQYILFGEVIYT